MCVGCCGSFGESGGSLGNEDLGDLDSLVGIAVSNIINTYRLEQCFWYMYTAMNQRLVQYNAGICIGILHLPNLLEHGEKQETGKTNC